MISVDTIQIRPVEEALQQGGLCMSTTPFEMVESLPVAWESYVINMSLIFLALLIFIFQLRRNLRIAPYLMEGLFRSKKLIDLEDGVRLIRDRNSLVINAVLVMSLISARYQLYHPSYMDEVHPGLQTIMVLGAFLLFILFRHLMIIGMSRYRLEGEQYQLNNRIANDYLIILTYFTLVAVGVLSVFNVSSETIRTVLYYLIAVVYVLFLLRRGQILSAS